MIKLLLLLGILSGCDMEPASDGEDNKVRRGDFFITERNFNVRWRGKSVYDSQRTGPNDCDFSIGIRKEDPNIYLEPIDARCPNFNFKIGQMAFFLDGQYIKYKGKTVGKLEDSIIEIDYRDGLNEKFNIEIRLYSDGSLDYKENRDVCSNNICPYQIEAKSLQSF